MRFCPNCGKKITSSTKFCPYCGAKQQVTGLQNNYQNYMQNSPMRRAKHSHKKILWSCLAVIILLAGGFSLYKYHDVHQAASQDSKISTQKETPGNKASSSSIDLDKEIPNDTWIVREKDHGSYDTTYHTRFHNDSVTGSTTKNGKIHTIHGDYLTPTGKRTLDLMFNENDLHMTMPYKVKSGNADHFKLSLNGNITGDLNGDHIRIHKAHGHFIANYKGHSKKLPKSEMKEADLTFTKE